MDMEFKIDNSLKQEYLNTKPTSTAESEFFVLRYFDDYEETVGKSVYNLNLTELNEMFSAFRNSSEESAGKNKSILVSYIDYCITKKVVNHMENRAKYIEIDNFVSKQATSKRYVNKNQLRESQNRLYNEQDQLLLWLPFISVLGRTAKGCSKEEIINLTIDDAFPEKNMLILRQNNGKFRELHNVDHFIFDLIRDAYEQNMYVENNGEQTSNERLGGDPRRIPINQTGEFSRYVFRIPGKDKFEPFKASLLNSRMRKIQEILDNKYITWTSLYLSGMIQMAMEIYNEKGEVTDDDFDKICVKFNYGVKEEVLPNDKRLTNYWFVLKKRFNKYKKSIS